MAFIAQTGNSNIAFESVTEHSALSPAQSRGYQIAMPEPTSLPKKDTSIDSRIQTIATYLMNATRLMSENPQSGLKILSLPEYTFDKPIPPRPGILRHKGKEVRQLSEVEYHQIDAAMRELSREYADVLIKVPVAWSKPARRASTLEKYLYSKSIKADSHPLYQHYQNKWKNKKTDNQSRKDKAQNANNIGSAKFGDRHSHDFPDINDETTDLARNTVLTYYNGDRISKYHKIMGMQEVVGSNENTRMQFFSGVDYGGQHVLPNSDVATQEICRDHSVNTASRAGNVHFVHSDGVRPSGPADKYENTSVVVHANTVKETADIFNPVTLQKVELIKKLENDGKTSRNAINPISVKNGIELYNIK